MIQANLINVLKQIKTQKIYENIQIKYINDMPIAKELIKHAILLDDENTCYHTYNSMNELIEYIMEYCYALGIFYEGKFIGLYTVMYNHEKDQTRLSLSAMVGRQYRNCGIGTYCLQQIIEKCIESIDFKCFHAAVRNDNPASQRILEKLNFKKYPGYKDDAYFKNLLNNKIPQYQYILRKRDYIKK